MVAPRKALSSNWCLHSSRKQKRNQASTHFSRTVTLLSYRMRAMPETLSWFLDPHKDCGLLLTDPCHHSLHVGVFCDEWDAPQVRNSSSAYVMQYLFVCTSMHRRRQWSFDIQAARQTWQSSHQQPFRLGPFIKLARTSPSVAASKFITLGAYVHERSSL